MIQKTVNEDPLRAIRACLEAARREENVNYDSLHRALFTKGFFTISDPKTSIEGALGFNFCLPDSRIDEHKTQRKARKELERLTENLGLGIEHQKRKEKGGRSRDE